jgi:hypothetical protein
VFRLECVEAQICLESSVFMLEFAYARICLYSTVNINCFYNLDVFMTESV